MKETEGQIQREAGKVGGKSKMETEIGQFITLSVLGYTAVVLSFCSAGKPLERVLLVFTAT